MMNGPDNMTDEEFVNWMHEQENSEGHDEEIEVDGTEVEAEEVFQRELNGKGNYAYVKFRLSPIALKDLPEDAKNIFVNKISEEKN